MNFYSFFLMITLNWKLYIVVLSYSCREQIFNLLEQLDNNVEVGPVLWVLIPALLHYGPILGRAI